MTQGINKATPEYKTGYESGWHQAWQEAFECLATRTSRLFLAGEDERAQHMRSALKELEAYNWDKRKEYRYEC
jgi:hypothetical protein